MTKLNKDTFEARFNELCAGIASAEQALGQASFQATTGYATQDDVDKAPRPRTQRPPVPRSKRWLR